MKVLVQKLAVLAVVGSVLTLSSCKKQQQQASVPNYKIITCQKSDATISHEYTCTLQGEQAVEIRPQISGTITRICVDEGQSVKKGQVLFIIDQAPYRDAIRQAQAQVSSARATLANSRLTLQSKRELRQQNVVSDFDLRQAENNASQAAASLANAQAQLQSARTNFSYTVVRSPANGVIGMINYRVGALVSASITNPLTTVSDNSRIRAYFSITENALEEYIQDYGSVNNVLKNLPPVQLKSNSGKLLNMSARIDAISGNVDSSTGAVTCRATFNNANGLLRNGGNGVIVMPYKIHQAIIIPQEATFDLQNKIFVYKVVNKKAKSQEIKIIDHSDGQHYIVLSGLNVGDRIVGEGAGLLSEGTQVEK